MKKLSAMVMGLVLSACTGVPKGVQPVDNFQLNRYLGTWYEIARLDHSFERGLSDISANYQLDSDGNVTVLNKGYNTAQKKWQQAVGKAKFAGDANTGHLKVSFFGPFYGSYVVFGLDQSGDNLHYQYAFVAGPNHEYLWLLSRTPTVSQAQIDNFRATAKRYGFNTDALIFVEHGVIK
ncbi:MAG: lipocalin family protein [Vibrionaceae bacterium]